jgi:hypothetical protein
MGMNPRLLRPTASNRFLLDQYGGAAAAYSLRRLRSSYGGAAVRVRRSNDNDEADFTPEEVANGTLTAWTGANNGFAVTWFDQSGSGNNLTQGTSGNQPQLVSSGALLLIKDRPCLLFDGSNDTVQKTGFSQSMNGLLGLTIVSVSRPNQTLNVNLQKALLIFLESGSFGGIAHNVGTNAFRYRFGTSFSADAGSREFTQAVTEALMFTAKRPTQDVARMNGVTRIQQNTTNPTANNSTTFDVGRGEASNHYNGRTAEVVVWAKDLFSVAQGIEQNINSHYKIF